MKEVEKYKIFAVIGLMIVIGFSGMILFGSSSLSSERERDLFISAGDYRAASNAESVSVVYDGFTSFSKALTLVGVMLLLLNLSQLAITKIDFMDLASNPRIMAGFMQMLGLLAIAIAIIMTFSYTSKSETMKSGQIAVNMIKEFEGFRSNAYLDAVNIPTIGFGTTKNIKMGMFINKKQADKYLKGDLFRFEKYLNRKILRPLTNYEFDALISFVYNIGSLKGNMYKSVIIGSPENIAYWMNKYVKAGGRILKGLVKRRKIESEVYVGECSTIKEYNRCFAC